MNYLNRFLIEEDTQFECAGVVDCNYQSLYDKNVTRSIRENLEKNFKTILNWSNSDSIGHLVFSGDFSTYYKTTFNDYIPRIEDFHFLITLTGSERLECIQKEQYEKFNTDGAQITSFLRTNPLFGTTKRIFTVKQNGYTNRYNIDDMIFGGFTTPNINIFNFTNLLEMILTTSTIVLKRKTIKRNTKMVVNLRYTSALNIPWNTYEKGYCVCRTLGSAKLDSCKIGFMKNWIQNLIHFIYLCLQIQKKLKCVPIPSKTKRHYRRICKIMHCHCAPGKPTIMTIVKG